MKAAKFQEPRKVICHGRFNKETVHAFISCRQMLEDVWDCGRKVDWDVPYYQGGSVCHMERARLKGYIKSPRVRMTKTKDDVNCEKCLNLLTTKNYQQKEMVKSDKNS